MNNLNLYDFIWLPQAAWAILWWNRSEKLEVPFFAVFLTAERTLLYLKAFRFWPVSFLLEQYEGEDVSVGLMERYWERERERDGITRRRNFPRFPLFATHHIWTVQGRNCTKKAKEFFCLMLSDIWRSISWSAGPQTSSTCPNKSNIQMKMSVERWWNDSNRENTKYLERSYFQINNLNDEMRNDKLLFDFTQYIISCAYVTYVTLNLDSTCKRKGRRIWIFNGRRHSEAQRPLATQKKLTYLGFHCLDHLPYSLDLAPSYYPLLPGLKKKTIERSPFFFRRRGHCCRGDLVGRTTFWFYFEWLAKVRATG